MSCMMDDCEQIPTKKVILSVKAKDENRKVEVEICEKHLLKLLNNGFVIDNVKGYDSVSKEIGLWMKDLVDDSLNRGIEFRKLFFENN